MYTKSRQLFCSDSHFLAIIEHKDSASKFKTHLNTPRHRPSSKQIPARVLSHWVKNGLIDDERPEGRGWHLFSNSDLLWIKIMSKLRAFGMSLEAIKTAKDHVERLRNDISKRPLLDFYIAYVMNEKKPAKLIVFDDGQAEFATAFQLEISQEAGMLTDDFITIDLARLSKQTKGVSWLQDNLSNPAVGAAQAKLDEGANSVTVEVKENKYTLTSKKKFDDRSAALAEKNLVKFGELREILNNGKSKFELTTSTHIKK